MPTAASDLLPRYQFGDLTLDLGQRRVKRGEESLELGKLTFDFLRVLVESSPNVVTYDELAEKVWGGRLVSPEAITQRVTVLRHALSDDADHPKYLEVLRSQGYRLIPEVSRLEALERQDRRRWGLALAAGLVTAFVALVSVYSFLEGKSGVLPYSVAVLPFENLSPDPDNAFFAAGIHEATLNQLAQISAINVIARTSMLRYANTEKSTAEIAEELNVQTVMEGSVQYDEGRVRVTAQLIDPQTSTHLWSESYARDLVDVFSIQVDIAERIAMALEAELLPSERQRIAKQPTNSPAAYQLYLRALTTAGTVAMQGPDAIAVANAYLDQAIELDPQFAHAYVRKAQLVPWLEAHSTRSYVEKALELDPNLAFAHSALATADASLLLEAEAREGYERALELSPNAAGILRDFALFNSFTEQHEDAIRLAQRAASLNPNSSGSHFTLGNVYLFAGNVDAAVDETLQASILYPADARHYLVLGRIEAGRGNQTEAAKYLQTAAQLIARDAPAIAFVAYGYALAGLHEQAVEFVTRFRALRSNSELLHALASLALGESDEALEFLTSLAEGEGQESSYGIGPMHIKFNVFSDPTLDEPEFVAVRQRLGFTDL